MNRTTQRTWRGIAAGVILVLSAACAAQPAARTSSTAAASRGPAAVVTLTLLHTNDTWGYLLPCG
ncbi:MAG: hypothetical protein FJ011_15375 [Chloroflexi bacterium]|nr:hypothetical protein [Chloroflexota bacterium]